MVCGGGGGVGRGRGGAAAASTSTDLVVSCFFVVVGGGGSPHTQLMSHDLNTVHTQDTSASVLHCRHRRESRLVSILARNETLNLSLDLE